MKIVIVFTCLMFYSQPGSSYGPMAAVDTNIASPKECYDEGNVWKKLGYGHDFRCLRIHKVVGQ